MRKLTYFIALSIDGYLAGPDDEVDFYPGGEEYTAWMTGEYPDVIPTHIRPQVGLAEAPNKRFDTILMGRRTYEPALKEGVTSPFAHLRQYVFSTTLDPAAYPDVTVVASDALATVRELKAEDSPLDIYLAGGGRFAGGLLPEIDRLVVKYYPVVAGAGQPAFDADFNPTRFDLTEVRRFESGNLVLTYDRP